MQIVIKSITLNIYINAWYACYALNKEDRVFVNN